MDQGPEFDEEEFNAGILEFLEEHPEWREDTGWEVLPGNPKPQALMRTKAMEAFIWGAYEKGRVKKPTNIPPLLEHLRSVEGESKAHKTGICNPETCWLCRQES